MERAVIYDFVPRENASSPLLQFESEGADPAAPSGDQPAMPARAIPLDPWPAQGFASESLEAFDAEGPAALRAVDDGDRGGGETPELFADLSAGNGLNWSRVLMGAVVLAVLVATGVPVSQWLLAPGLQAEAPGVNPVTTGMLVIVTNPPGVIALIDGTPSGITPLNQKLIAGNHTVELRGSGPSRTIAVTVAPGGRAFQYVELPGATPDVEHLEPSSDAPATIVTVGDSASANHRH
jgi:hypothetical protein